MSKTYLIQYFIEKNDFPSFYLIKTYRNSYSTTTFVENIFLIISRGNNSTKQEAHGPHRSPEEDF